MPCVQFFVNGQVQGVGFRPFVYRLAVENRLCGHVRNTPEGVEILLQGKDLAIEHFEDQFARNLPPLARITALNKRPLPEQSDRQHFQIEKSRDGASHQVLITPDTATCPECLREIDDPGDRRLGYAFTNCTNCGPRFTITRSIPYDRDQTSMACFPMCPDCRREYEDPLDRRFHAQPNACPECGPRLWYTTSRGERIEGDGDCLMPAARDLHEGHILAIKGLGGFHLACLAFAPESIERLRRRKNRPGKPLAVMVPDLAAATGLAEISDREQTWLCSWQRPIVLVNPKNKLLPEILAPDTHRVGIMLPYTPLHHLLLQACSRHAGTGKLTALVMTSGNLSANPLALGNREALATLRGIADRFLLHNRDICIRCDDSVLAVTPTSQRNVFFRRARGFTPSPIFFKKPGPSVLGLGAEKKATVCLTQDNRAYVSQHIGDLTTVAGFEYFQETIRHLQTILKIRPQGVIIDLHPDFLSSRYAEQWPDLPRLTLQHHFAHLYAVLGEHQLDEPILGLALDGSGLGTDHSIWGGELLLLDPRGDEQSRLGHFAPVPLPGGDAAVVEPWKTALGVLQALGHPGPVSRNWPWSRSRSREAALLQDMLDKNINSPLTTSCGRLFDAVAALLGLSLHIDYEGQAAIRLESIQDRSEKAAYPCPLIKRDPVGLLDTLTLFQAVLKDWDQRIPAARISRRFHLGLLTGLCHWAQAAARATGLKKIGLSGGVFQNLTLADELPGRLEQAGLEVLQHRVLPPNDGCIAFGQAVFGQYRLKD